MSVQAEDRPEGLSAYVAVTAAYWAFMLTDGALRMLVLLHFHSLGFSPVQLAYLFVLYEIAGMVTNLSAGWIAVRFGLTSTLYAGLGLQVTALLALTQLDPSWSIGASVVFVMCVQGASGVAKDLAKMSSKSAVKLLAPSERGGLFRWVAVLTGSKNAVKGVGFLLGAALLASLGFKWAVYRQLSKKLTWFKTLDDARQNVLVNMAFNLGVAGLMSFKNMLEYVFHYEYDDAAKEMLNSKWARQVGYRAQELAEQMRTGEYQ